MLKKYFTLEQAQEILKEVKEIMQGLLQNKENIDLLNSIKIDYSEDYQGEFNELNFTKINKEFHKLSYEFFARIEDLESKGCILKDLNEGLVDFYSIFEGREILLCWKYGEENIEYWHDLESGFAGRQHIAELIKKSKKYQE